MTQKTVTRTTNEVMERMRNWRSVHMAHSAQLFDDVVKEMDRLQKVIDDYVYIAAASAREIKQLRQSYEKSDETRGDSDMSGGALTDEEREAVDAAAHAAARLAALEELSALDQALELEYGLTGNPMIKAQEHTPQTQPTPGEGSEPREGT